MHYLGKPGPITLRGEGWRKGGADGRRILSPLTLYFLLFSSTIPFLLACILSAQDPFFQIRELLTELSLVLVYHGASHQVLVSPFTDWHGMNRGYELSDQHPVTSKQYDNSYSALTPSKHLMSRIRWRETVGNVHPEPSAFMLTSDSRRTVRGCFSSNHGYKLFMRFFVPFVNFIIIIIFFNQNHFFSWNS